VKLFIANLSFTYGMEMLRGKSFGKVCIEVTADTIRAKGYRIESEDYFPELFVSKWFREREHLEVPIYTFRRCGVKPLTESYMNLAEALQLDCIILVDGGTDSLMRGDEDGLGTPTEDMSSICAVNAVNVAKKYLACIGFGIDSFHGVCHSHFLENVASLTKENAFLGAFSMLPNTVEAIKFKEAYLASQPNNSIVCSSVLSAVEGEFGDHHSPYTKDRTGSSKLYISPLMSMWWCFDLEAVAKRVLYLDKIKNTETASEVAAIINSFESNLSKAGKKRTTIKRIPY